MAQEKIILGIIPARGGSKRIPKKNIKKLGNKPLIAWTIDAADKSRLLDDVIVSTDNQEIQEIAERFGIRVIERPKILATDWAKTIDVILDVLRREGADIVVCLQPTSPFRLAADIDNAINLFLHRKCDSVISVCESKREHCWFLRERKEYIVPIFGHKYLGMRSQRLPRLYIPNGAIYVASAETLRKYKTFYTDKILPYIMPVERSIDIDDFDDFVIAEAMIKK